MTSTDNVRAALDSLPPNIASALKNVAIVVEDENADDPDLFGLSTVSPCPNAVTSRDSSPTRLDLPATARGQLSRPSGAPGGDPVTVLHELAHYFGLDEDRIAELGYE